MLIMFVHVFNFEECDVGQNSREKKFSSQEYNIINSFFFNSF